MYKIGDVGYLNWADGSKSKVKIMDIVYSQIFVNEEYWLDYDEKETNRPLIHELYGTELKYPILLWRTLLDKHFTKLTY